MFLVTLSVPALCAGCEQTLNYPILCAYDFLFCHVMETVIEYRFFVLVFYQSLKCWYRDSLLCCTVDYTAH